MKIQSITSGRHTALYITNLANKPSSHLFSEWAKAEAERIREQQIQNKTFSMYSKNIYLALSLFGVIGVFPPNTLRLYIKVLFSSSVGNSLCGEGNKNNQHIKSCFTIILPDFSKITMPEEPLTTVSSPLFESHN